MNVELNRRRFVQLLGALSAESGWYGKTTGIAVAQETTHKAVVAESNRSATINRKNVVGIQVKPFAWVDEGIDKLLDTLQEKGNVNTVFVYTYDYDPNRTTQGGPIPLPDHGKYGSGKLRTGGAFYDYDLKYFQDTTLRDFRSRDEPNFNVITAVAHQQFISPQLILQNSLYALFYTAMALSSAVLVFERRNLK